MLYNMYMIYIYFNFYARKPQRIVPNGRCNTVVVDMVTYLYLLYIYARLFLMGHLQRRVSATSLLLFERFIRNVYLHNNNIIAVL